MAQNTTSVVFGRTGGRPRPGGFPVISLTRDGAFELHITRPMESAFNLETIKASDTTRQNAVVDLGKAEERPSAAQAWSCMHDLSNGPPQCFWRLQQASDEHWRADARGASVPVSVSGHPRKRAARQGRPHRAQATHMRLPTLQATAAMHQPPPAIFSSRPCAESTLPRRA